MCFVWDTTQNKILWLNKMKHCLKTRAYISLQCYLWSYDVFYQEESHTLIDIRHTYWVRLRVFVVCTFLLTHTHTHTHTHTVLKPHCARGASCLTSVEKPVSPSNWIRCDRVNAMWGNSSGSLRCVSTLCCPASKPSEQSDSYLNQKQVHHQVGLTWCLCFHVSQRYCPVCVSDIYQSVSLLLIEDNFRGNL